MTPSIVLTARGVRAARLARRCFGVALAGALASSIAHAQTSTGSLRGRVVDTSGAGVSGASIRVNGTPLGASTDARRRLYRGSHRRWVLYGRRPPGRICVPTRSPSPCALARWSRTT